MGHVKTIISPCGCNRQILTRLNFIPTYFDSNTSVTFQKHSMVRMTKVIAVLVSKHCRNVGTIGAVHTDCRKPREGEQIQ